MKNIAAVLFFIMAGLAFPQEIQNLEAEQISALENRQTEILIKSNVQKASVYLNNQFQGKTSLGILNLVEGIYILRVEKKGWQPQVFKIQVEAGTSREFYVELKKEEKEAEE